MTRGFHSLPFETHLGIKLLDLSASKKVRVATQLQKKLIKQKLQNKPSNYKQKLTRRMFDY